MTKTDGKKKFNIYLLLIPLIIVGIIIMAYPYIRDYISTLNHQAAITTYESEADQLPAEFVEGELSKARAYNDQLEGKTLSDPFGKATPITNAEYGKLLNLNGMMGIIRIPAIKVDLPIYHGVSDEVLKKGVGHLFGSSLPVGGSKTHAVLTAHAGYTNAKLFTDLEKVQLGDRFYLDIFNRTLAYQVEQILVVEPDQVEELAIVPGKDYVTLVTCTPYGINSHRLFVRGSRVALDSDAAKLEAVASGQQHSMPTGLIVIIAAVLAALIALLIIRLRARRRRKDYGKQHKGEKTP